jgi:hypothetical protein
MPPNKGTGAFTEELESPIETYLRPFHANLSKTSGGSTKPQINTHHVEN